MPVEIDPDRVGRVGVRLPEGAAPVRVPEVEVEVVDEGRLAAPLHMRAPRVLLALGPPRPPAERLLLRDPEQDDATAITLLRGRLDQWPGIGLLALTLLEVVHGDAAGLGPPSYSRRVLVADLAKSRRRRDRKPSLHQKASHPAGRLQLGHVPLQEDSIHRPAGQRDLIAQQRRIIHPSHLLV